LYDRFNASGRAVDQTPSISGSQASTGGSRFKQGGHKLKSKSPKSSKRSKKSTPASELEAAFWQERTKFLLKEGTARADPLAKTMPLPMRMDSFEPEKIQVMQGDRTATLSGLLLPSVPKGRSVWDEGSKDPLPFGLLRISNPKPRKEGFGTEGLRSQGAEGLRGLTPDPLPFDSRPDSRAELVDQGLPSISTQGVRGLAGRSRA